MKKITPNKKTLSENTYNVTQITNQLSESKIDDLKKSTKSDDDEKRVQLVDFNVKDIIYVQYKNEEQLKRIKSLMDIDLSEPYSIYTYRYFVNNWPELTILAKIKLSEQPSKEQQKNDILLEKVEDTQTGQVEWFRYMGAIVCKSDGYKENRLSHLIKKRGYIAMLAVDKSYRKRGIGSILVSKMIKKLERTGHNEVVLETEIINKGALKLYTNLGFIVEKRLHCYYLNQGDAFRLKLFL